MVIKYDYLIKKLKPNLANDTQMKRGYNIVFFIVCILYLTVLYSFSYANNG